MNSIGEQADSALKNANRKVDEAKEKIGEIADKAVELWEDFAGSVGDFIDGILGRLGLSSKWEEVTVSPRTRFATEVNTATSELIVTWK